VAFGITVPAAAFVIGAFPATTRRLGMAARVAVPTAALVIRALPAAP
jgi:hypothetical protein